MFLNRINFASKKVTYLLVALVCFVFAFPVLWLLLTSVRPVSGMYYVHRGLDFTLGNFADVLKNERVMAAFFNSAVICK